MILIAESGSTKTDWIVLDNKYQKINRFSTSGLNPIIMSLEEIKASLSLSSILRELSFQTEKVFFFGAGCSSKIRKSTIKIALENIFQRAIIEVENDMVGAVYAAYEGKPVITSIIGTGSNSCFFDGTNILQTTPALGFILGDEASGTYFGKFLLRSRLYGKLPHNLQLKFDKEYNIDLENIISKTYNEPWPNKFLASFMPFIIENKTHPFFNKKIKEGFREFITNFVKPYLLIGTEVEVSYVGSIASLLSEELDSVSLEMEIPIGKKLQWPIDSLANYLIEYTLK